MKRTTLILALILATPSWAGFTSRSSMTPGRSYTSTRPTAPAPRVVQHNTTVVQQTVVQKSSGGGMMSAIVGSAIGSGISNWLFAPKAASSASTPAPVDCNQNPKHKDCQQ